MIFHENHDFPRISLSGAWRLLEAPRSSRSHQRARSRPANLGYRLRIIHNAATNIPDHLEVSPNSLKALEHSQMRLQKNTKKCKNLQPFAKILQKSANPPTKTGDLYKSKKYKTIYTVLHFFNVYFL